MGTCILTKTKMSVQPTISQENTRLQTSARLDNINSWVLTLSSTTSIWCSIELVHPILCEICSNADVALSSVFMNLVIQNTVIAVAVSIPILIALFFAVRACREPIRELEEGQTIFITERLRRSWRTKYFSAVHNRGYRVFHIISLRELMASTAFTTPAFKMDDVTSRGNPNPVW